MSEENKTEIRAKWATLTPNQKFARVAKICICIVSGGMIFPTAFDG